jgi:hypothetical protein
MWHPLTFVADERSLDAEQLTTYALANQDKYGIINEHGRAQVNTWHVDALVAAFQIHAADKGAKLQLRP